MTKPKAETEIPCALCVSVLKLSQSRLTSFYDAMIDVTINDQTIFDVLRKWGVHSSLTTIHLHRTGNENRSLHMVNNIKKAAGR